MNEYFFNVNFEKGKIKTDLKELVQNDYNSTKINFTFDKEGRVLFKLKFPDGTSYVDDIENNEYILTPGILSQSGNYQIEISLYTTDGRLTDYTIYDNLYVRAELVNENEAAELDDRVPVLSGLINDVNTVITEVNNLDLDVEKVGKVATISLTKKNGTTKEEQVTDGYSLDYDWEGTSLGIKKEDDEEYEYVDLKGDRGDSYVITPQDYNAIAGIVETNIQPTLTNIQNTANSANGTANTAKETADTASGVASSANTTANTAKSIAEGANQALSYSNYSTMITDFNALDDDVYRVGQNMYILTLDVPDLWISSIESTSSTYTYTTDSAFISTLETNGYVQVGYYKLSALETQKVDLTNYATKDEFVTLTQAQYDALQTINPDVYYYIIEE